MEENYQGLAGKIVRVGSYILPKWALNNHHFVYFNYMSLEQDYTRHNLNHWIDLIFGKKQQSVECMNLFKPLTSEVISEIIYILE